MWQRLGRALGIDLTRRTALGLVFGAIAAIAFLVVFACLYGDSGPITEEQEAKDSREELWCLLIAGPILLTTGISALLLLLAEQRRKAKRQF